MHLASFFLIFFLFCVPCQAVSVGWLTRQVQCNHVSFQNQVGGGDVSRKRKLLEKQKKGKARMKTIGSVQLSQEAFHSVLSRE